MYLIRLKMFKNKVLLISGGTGSFGGAVLRRFLTTNIKEIRIFSRDELKQDDMRRYYNNDKLKFYIGDVRDKNSIDDAMSREEIVVAEDMGEYYRIPPDLRDLNYDKFVEQGEERISHAEDYNSYNTERLNIEGMKLLLMKLDFMQAAIRGEFVDSEE